MSNKVSQIVEEQIKAWSRNSTIKTSKTVEEQKHKSALITISREYGAKGARLAKFLGNKTGYDVWDKNILQEIANDLNSDKKIVESLDERRQQIVEDTVSVFLNNVHTNVKYLRSLARVVRSIEEHGKAIVVGRGANYICQNPYSLHLRVVSPLNARVADYSERKQITKAKAKEIINQKDRERAEFIKRNFSKDVTNASDYDLLINSDVFTLEQMSEIVIEAYRKKSGVELPLLA